MPKHTWFGLVWFGFMTYQQSNGGARGVMVIAVGNGHGDLSSKPGRDWLHFTYH